MRNRWNVLYDLIIQNNYKTFVEVGVFKGDTSRFLLANIPDLKIYAIDPYCGYKHFNPTKELMDDAMFEAHDVLFDERCIFIREFSEKAIEQFPEDNLFDIVFIDANHTFRYVDFDVRNWYRKVRSGGILSGHDFWVNSKKNKPVKQVVKVFQQETGLELHLDSDGVWYFKKQ